MHWLILAVASYVAIAIASNMHDPFKFIVDKYENIDTHCFMIIFCNCKNLFAFDFLIHACP